MNKYCTIYLVRHGQAQSNIDKIMAGVTDAPLTEEGAKQAEIRKQEFESIKFDGVFSSDLVRAKRTAEIIAAERQLAINTRELLRERHFGDWEGKPEEGPLQIIRESLEKIKNSTDFEKRQLSFISGFENDNEITSRMLIVLREIAAAYLGQTILVASHGSIMRALLCHLGFGTYDELPPGCIENTGYFILESDGVDFFIKQTVGVTKKTL